MTKFKAASSFPPIAEKIPFGMHHHGQLRMDPYYWMNDRNNPAVIAYLNQENAYLKSQMKHTETFQELLFKEMKGRIKEDDESVPVFREGYHYYHKFIKGGEYPIYCRKHHSLHGDEEIILDVNELAKDHAYFHVSGLTVSSDHQLLAFGQDHIGRRIYTIRFKNLITGEIFKESIPEVTGNLVWANDNLTVFYSKQDPNTLRANQIFQHVLGTDPKEDRLVFEEKDETFTCHVQKSKSREFLFIASQSTVSSEFRFLDANQPHGNWKLVQERKRDLEYEVEHYGEEFIILTNAGEAKNFKLVKTPVAAPGIDNWKDLIPHRETVYLENMEVFKDFLVLEERCNGLTRIAIRTWDGSQQHDIEFDEPTYTAWISHNPTFETNVLRYGYNSLVSPSSIYDYHMVSKEKTLLKQQEVVGGYDQKSYQSERVWATATDGTLIPVSLVYKKNLFKKDGSNPLLQYAYGSYGYSTDALFSTHRLSLLDRGFVFAIAHIRGGQEMGRQWYESGKLLKKMNTFTDFMDCSKYLIEMQYTRPERLFAMGGSAGGLLMGVIINENPSLYKGVVAAVPFVDVVTTMLDDSIPLTTGEFDEWGNPKEKAYYDYMLSYSPYDQVKAQNYPNLLVTSGLHDSQVQYWEPTKWVAKLRDLKTDDNLLLLHTNMDAGHGGVSGRFRALRELALEYAFILDLAGQTNPIN